MGAHGGPKGPTGSHGDALGIPQGPHVAGFWPRRELELREGRENGRGGLQLGVGGVSRAGAVAEGLQQHTIGTLSENVRKLRKTRES